MFLKRVDRILSSTRYLDIFPKIRKVWSKCSSNSLLIEKNKPFCPVACPSSFWILLADSWFDTLWEDHQSSRDLNKTSSRLYYTYKQPLAGHGCLKISLSGWKESNQRFGSRATFLSLLTSDCQTWNWGDILSKFKIMPNANGMNEYGCILCCSKDFKSHEMSTEEIFWYETIWDNLISCCE